MYCIYCGKKVKDESADTCPFCGKEMIKAELDHDQTRQFSKTLHNNLNKSRENFDNAMVFVVLGAILFAIGFLFFFLAFKLPNAASHDKILTVTCPEFWVSMVGLVGGAAGLIYGTIRVTLELLAQKKIMRVLRLVQNEKYSHLHCEF